MEFGAVLPQIGWGPDNPFTLDVLERYVTTARALGFTWITANDHIVYKGPWIDGPTALAASLPLTDGMTLATTIGLPVVRGPAVFAKTMAQLDQLSGGRVIAGVSTGSSEADYTITGTPYHERGRRLDEAIGVMRALWQPGGPAFHGEFYSTDGTWCDPPPARPGGPPIWVGSWGSERAMHRVATLGDGWLASAYNTTPERFAKALEMLSSRLTDAGRDPSTFPHALATTWMHVGDDGEAMLSLMATAMNRPIDDLRQSLPMGTASQVAEIVDRYREAGLQRMLVWPFGGDPVEQLERFADAAMSERE